MGGVVISGIDMLLYQGAKAFELIFSSDPPIEVMRDELLEATKNC
jgi:shikimate 5-dehydrogenase